MSKNFSNSFEIIHEKFCEYAKNSGARGDDLSLAALMRFLGVTSGKFFAWKKGQWPSAEDLATIAAKLGFSYRWLVTGEGDPFSEGQVLRGDAPQAADDLAATEAGGAQARCRELEQENAQLREHLKDKEKIISLYEKRADGVLPLPAPKEPSAPDIGNAAPLSRLNND